jgi:hypothetical protein
MFGFRQFISDHDEDSNIISLYLNNSEIPISEIANRFKKSVAEIYRILHSHQIPLNRSKIHHHKVHSLNNMGWNVLDISKFTGYTPRNIRYIISKAAKNGN